MYSDPIVEEIRRIRDEREKKFGYDLHLMCEDFRKYQPSPGHELVSIKTDEVFSLSGLAASRDEDLRNVSRQDAENAEGRERTDEHTKK